MVAVESGGKPHAIQTLRAVSKMHGVREAFGVRLLQHRFGMHKRAAFIHMASIGQSSMTSDPRAGLEC